VRGLHRRELLLLAAIVTIGIAVRVWIAFTNYGLKYDIDSFYIVTRLLVSHPLHAYSSMRWPYPAGDFPILLACHAIAHALGVAFWAIVKVPAIVCDAGIAAVLAWGLDRFGAGAREILIGVSLVALGPVFILIDGYHGQIDAIATLPALAGLIVWKLGGEQRAWQAGVLIGVATAVKQPPFFVALALLPTARGKREVATLLGCAAAIPALSVAPFLLANPHPTWTWLTTNRGVVGLGGLSVLIQPSLVRGIQHLYFVPRTAATTWFYARQNWIVAAGVLLAAAHAYRRRLDPVPAAALIWLTVYVFNFNWAYQYFLWGLPFFLLAGWWLESAVLQLALMLPASQIYFHFGLSSLGGMYVPMIIAIWVGIVVWLVAAARHPRLGPARLLHT
jgi:hypothetical protein